MKLHLQPRSLGLKAGGYSAPVVQEYNDYLPSWLWSATDTTAHRVWFSTTVGNPKLAVRALRDRQRPKNLT